MVSHTHLFFNHLLTIMQIVLDLYLLHPHQFQFLELHHDAM